MSDEGRGAFCESFSRKGAKFSLSSPDSSGGKVRERLASLAADEVFFLCGFTSGGRGDFLRRAISESGRRLWVREWMMREAAMASSAMRREAFLVRRRARSKISSSMPCFQPSVPIALRSALSWEKSFVGGRRPALAAEP